MNSTTTFNKREKYKAQINVFNQKVPNREKEARDGAWFEEMADMMIGYNSGEDVEKRDQMKKNFDLYNSRGDQTDYNDLATLMALQKEGVGGVHQTRHYDIVASIASNMVGEQEKRPFVPICVDVSENGLNQIKRKRQELVQQYIHSKVIQPLIDQITAEVQEQLQGQMQGQLDESGNPMQPSQEQTQQAEQQIQQQVQTMTPEEIHRYMRKDFKGASSIQGQKILNYYIRELNLKYTFSQGFKNFIITGLPVFYGGIRNGKVVAELVKPNKFKFGGSENIMFVEDADWWVYEENISFPEVYKRYGSVLTKDDQDKLDKFYDNFYGNNTQSHTDNKLVAEVALDPDHYGLSDADLLTKDGQRKMMNAYEKVFYANDGTAPIIHNHVVFKSLTKFKYITREDENKEETYFWFDGDYEFNPMLGDIEEKEVWLPQIYEVVKLHYGSSANSVYLLKRPIPDQHRSLDDPFTLKGPYYGIAWNSFAGNSKFLAPLDKAKPYIYDYNVIRSKINEIIKNDKGKVLMTSFSSKPKDWSWGKWLAFFKEGLALVDTSNMQAHEAQIFKEVNLSGATELAGYLQYLESIKQDAANSMCFNSSRLGQISPYLTATNNQQNIMQSLNQTEDIFSTFNKVQENFLTYVVRLSKTEFRENPVALTYVLDDMSIAELEVDEDMLSDSKFGVYISNSADDQDNLNMTKANLTAMIQSQMINFPEYIKTQWSKSAAEVQNIAEEAKERIAQEQEAERQQAKELQQMQQEAMEEQARMLHERAKELKMMDIQSALDTAMIQAMTFANQKDIDQDNINDDMEIKMREMQAAREENQKDRVLELEKLKKQIDADLLKLRLDNEAKIKIAKMKPKPTKK